VREPGKTLAHIEFTKDGRYALASVWEMDGALIVYDAQTFKEVKRLPMSKPVGKYNVWNKITRSEGLAPRTTATGTAVALADAGSPRLTSTRQALASE
jgi:hypothetical protein